MDTSCTKNQHDRVSDQTFLASELLMCGTICPLIQLILHLLLILTTPLCAPEVLSKNFLSICIFDIIISTSLNVLFLQIVLFSFLFYGSCKCKPLCLAIMCALSSSCCLFDVFFRQIKWRWNISVTPALRAHYFRIPDNPVDFPYLNSVN